MVVTQAGIACAHERRSGARPRQVDFDAVRRLCGYTELQAVTWFRLLVRGGYSDILGLLLLMTHVVIARPSHWDYAQVRKDHETAAGQRAPVVLGRVRACVACGDYARLYFHHVIEVQNGGSNWHWNQVQICFACHEYLHPWLKELPMTPAPRPLGMQSLSEIVALASDKPFK